MLRSQEERRGSGSVLQEQEHKYQRYLKAKTEKRETRQNWVWEIRVKREIWNKNQK